MINYKYVTIEDIIYEADGEIIIALVKDFLTKSTFKIKTNINKEQLEEQNHNGIIITGNKEIDDMYGEQFKTETVSFPFSKEAAQHQLKNIKGIGKKRTNDIFNAFTPFTMELLIDDPNNAGKLRFLSDNLKTKVQQWFLDNRDRLNIKRPFLIYGFKDNEADFIIKNIAETLEDYQKNPYYVLDFMTILPPEKENENRPKFTFKKLDELVLKNHVPIDEDTRLFYAIDYVCKTVLPNESGDTYFFKSIIINMIKNEIITETTKTKKELEAILKNHKKLVEVHTNYFEHETLYKEENMIFNTINNNYQIENKNNLPDINELFKHNNFKFNQDQQNAIINALTNKISFITGGPGTGKTTTVNGIARMFYEQYMQNSSFNSNQAGIFGFAPTGRAAKRMRESITSVKNIEINTLHKLIHNESLKIKIESTEKPLILIDEASMIDTHTLYKFLFNTPVSAQIVFIGDVNQLPPIGYGQIFKDCINEQKVTISNLKTIYRQGADSNIINLCLKIKDHMNVTYENHDDLTMKNVNAQTEILNYFKHQKLNILENKNLYDIQIITPYRENKSTSANVLNQKLQPIINDEFHTSPPSKQFKRFNKTFVIGDKVIHLQNTKLKAYDSDGMHYVANGEIGIIKNIYYTEKNTAEIIVEYHDENSKSFKVIYPSKDLTNILDHAYAITTHKCQGSEFDEVIIPIPDFNTSFLSNNMIYTAASRAKQHLHVYGSDKVFNKMIHTEIDDKLTYFGDLIIEKE